MAEMHEIMRLHVKFDDVSDLTSSRLLSMAEAALDVAQPHWRYHVPEIRQKMKNEMFFALFEAAIKNPVGKRCGVAMSEGGHNEQPAPPHAGM